MKKISSKEKSNNIRTAKKTAPKKSTKINDESEVESESADISALILRDHKPIKELILILKDPEISFSKKQPAFAELERTLSCHAKAEEESLYVHLKQEDDLRVEGLEGDTEHAIADQLMAEINESKGDEDVWMAKVKVLAELVDHHVKEEEKEVLKEVRKEFSTEQRTEIGEMYSRLLEQYEQETAAQRKRHNKSETRVEHVQS